MNHAIEMYSVCYFEYDGTQQIAPHSHDATYQVYYVKDGQNRFLYDSEWITLVPGQFLLICPGYKHAMITQGPSNVLDIKFDIFDPLLRASVEKHLAGLQNVTPETEPLLLSMIALNRENNNYFQRISSLYVETILYLMLQRIAPLPPYIRDDPIEQFKHYKLSPCVKRAIPFIEGAVVYPVETFSPNTIANQIGYNTRYVSSKFSEELGISVTKYFRCLQINKAKDLLYNTDLRISAISDLLNYEDVSKFIKHFKKSTGMSPREYRNHYRNEII